MSNSVVKIPFLGIKRIKEIFEISADDSYALRAMGALYAYYASTQGPLKKRDAVQAAAEEVIENASCGYLLCEEYGEDFVKDDPDADLEALMTAAIIGGSLLEIDSNVLGEDLTDRAIRIYNGALCIASGGNYDVDSPEYKASSCLGHIIMFEEIKAIDWGLPYYTKDMILEAIPKKINPVWQRIDSTTRLGQEMITSIDALTTRIDKMTADIQEAERISALPAPAPRNRAHLHVVTDKPSEP